jgi:small subunit ribosomal protein S13
LARIAGVDLPKNKHMDRALTYIHGIGLTSARQILNKVDLPYTMSSDDLNGDDVNRIRKVIEDEYSVEGDRRREVSMDIKRLMDLGCYRGKRHRAGLPCRGQNTKTNARTRKGPRRGASRRK